MDSKINIKLKSYEDIFSDFDSRPYLVKSLSTDFLSEIKLASLDKTNRINMEIAIPSSKRNKLHEKNIKKRLKNHFNKHLILLKKEKRIILLKGIIFSIIGIIAMSIAIFMSPKYGDDTFFKNFLTIFLEPGGLFLFWSGLDLIIFLSNENKKDLDFYKKMSKCSIDFLSY